MDLSKTEGFTGAVLGLTMATALCGWVGNIIGLAVELAGWLLPVLDFFVVWSSRSIIRSEKLLLFESSNYSVM